MAYIQPFAAVTFDTARAGALADLICPPYDVISPDEQARLHEASAFNIVRLELGRDQPDDGPGHDRYTRAGAQFEAWLAEGVLREDGQPAFYVYDQQWGDRHRQAFFAAVRLAPWSAGEVLPHELTLSGPKKDRLELMRHTAANMSPVMGLYDDPDGSVAALLDEARRSEPVLHAQVGTERHTLWRLDAWDAIAALQEALAGRPIFIADGHHRYETALTYRDERREAQGAYSGEEPWNYVMMALCAVDDPGLVVLPTHRLVRAPALAAESLLARLAERFELTTVPLGTDRAIASREAATAMERVSSTHRIGMILADRPTELHLLRLASAPEAALNHLPHSKPWRELDVAQLHHLIIAGILGIPESEWKGGQHIVYTRDVSEVIAGVFGGDFQVGFLLDSTPVAQIKRVSLAGDVMPQKSTYFYPKMPTGLVVHRLAEHPARVGASS